MEVIRNHGMILAGYLEACWVWYSHIDLEDRPFGLEDIAVADVEDVVEDDVVVDALVDSLGLFADSLEEAIAGACWIAIALLIRSFAEDPMDQEL